jgi:hypothetical protein
MCTSSKVIQLALYANTVSISFHAISSAPLVKRIMKEEELYVNNPAVTLMFKCTDAKKILNRFNDRPKRRV